MMKQKIEKTADEKMWNRISQIPAVVLVLLSGIDIVRFAILGDRTAFITFSMIAVAFMLFFKVIMPLLKPTMVTCFILQFMGVWSDFLTPLYLSSKSKMFPMTMAVYQFFGKNKSYWNYIFADIVLTCIPVVIVYMIGQKYIVGGMTSGAVKE